MSGEAQAPPDYRYMIRAFADVLDPGNADDLQNINTSPLPNGALCYVISKRAAYVLDKFSDASADGAMVYAPSAGPGRWTLFSAAAGAAPPAMAYSTAGQNNTFVLDDAYNQPNTANFLLNEGNELARWDFTASGCILTWQGPTLPMLITLTAAVSVADGTPAQTVRGFVSLNNESPGAGQGGPEGIQLVVIQGDGTNWSILASQRFITAVSNGSTLRPKFSGSAGGTTGNIASLQLIAQPL